VTRQNFKLCSSCRDWLPLTKFVKRSAKCHQCRAAQERLRIERARNRRISELLRYPRALT
jgi:hypothetical protein